MKPFVPPTPPLDPGEVPELRVRSTDSPGRCPLCHVGFEGARHVLVCTQCKAWLHLGCVGEARPRRCGACGGSAVPAEHGTVFERFVWGRGRLNTLANAFVLLSIPMITVLFLVFLAKRSPQEAVIGLIASLFIALWCRRAFKPKRPAVIDLRVRLRSSDRPGKHEPPQPTAPPLPATKPREQA